MWFKYLGMESSYYNQDLSYIHDAFFSQVAANAAEFISSNFPAANFPTLVDLGCGSGSMASILVKRSYDITGIDFSKHMVKLAQE